MQDRERVTCVQRTFLNIAACKSVQSPNIHMKTGLLSLLPAVIVVLCATSNAAAESGGDYIKVEIKGTLQTGVMAIGAETTGTVIRANNVTWELDLSDNPQLQEEARKLDRKTVLVTGTYEKRKGVEIRERHVVKVAALKSAE